jgi:type II secretory pathway pseudopilin PulG
MNPRTLAIAAAMLALVVIIALSGSGLNPWVAAKRANARADVATQQAAVETKTTEVLDRVVRSEVIIRNQAQGAVEHVEAAIGTETPLPPAVGAAVRSGVDGMRNGSGSGANHDPGKPASAL